MKETPDSVRWIRGKPYFRARLSNGERPAILLAVRPADSVALAERVKTIGDMLGQLRDAGRPEYEEHWVRKMARASTPEEIEGFLIAVKAICSGTTRKKPLLSGALPLQEFGELWTTGELARMYPKHVRQKKTANNDGWLLKKYAYPVAGRTPVSAFVLEHGQEILRRVPPDKSDVTVRHVAQCLHRLFNLAVFPARLIEHSPLPRGFLPQIVHRRAKTYLYPDEDATLLGCREVPLVLRVLYGFLNREGCRVTEATTLDFRDVDLEYGEIHLDANKTNDPRSWAMGFDTAEALRRWRDHFHPNPKPEQRIFVYPDTSREAGEQIDGAARAEEFRANLKRAGLARPQLFMNDRERRHICIHDLRATFVTLALASGKNETWVADRTGHSSSDQIHNYRRQARTHAELKLGALASLHEAIPELRAAVPIHPVQSSDPQRRGSTGDRPQERENQMHSQPSETTAERAGFEPAAPLRVHMISNHAPSATRSPLQSRRPPWGPAASRIRYSGGPDAASGRPHAGGANLQHQQNA
jgi:integrase